MKRQVKEQNCPSRSRRSRAGRRRHGSESGFIFLIVMIVAIFLLIAMTAAAPSIFTEGRREQEKELIFRGKQYAIAIYHFDQQFHRYPASVKELLHTNNLSFLRRAWPDPMTQSGKWRFIHCTANGVITDSETLGIPGKNSSLPGSALGASSESPPAAGQNPGFEPPGLGAPGPFGEGASNGSGSPNPFGKIEGAYLCGVASTSMQASIMRFNHHGHYNHWEFIGVPGVPGSIIASPQGAPGQPLGAPNQPVPGAGYGGGMGANPATNPFTP